MPTSYEIWMYKHNERLTLTVDNETSLPFVYGPDPYQQALAIAEAAKADSGVFRIVIAKTDLHCFGKFVYDWNR